MTPWTTSLAPTAAHKTSGRPINFAKTPPKRKDSISGKDDGFILVRVHGQVSACEAPARARGHDDPDLVFAWVQFLESAHPVKRETKL